MQHKLTPKDAKLNSTLIKMWRINNALARKVFVTKGDLNFYNSHIGVIQKYYTDHAQYWSKMVQIHSIDVTGSPMPDGLNNKRKQLALFIEAGMNIRRMNQNELAHLLHKHPSEVSKFLSGNHNFTIETLMDIERVLDIKIINT